MGWCWSVPVLDDGDAAVTADQGGKGFKGDGWQTNVDFELIGDPRVVKGGVFKEYQLDFPSNLRLKVYPHGETLQRLLRPLETQAFSGNQVARSRSSKLGVSPSWNAMRLITDKSMIRPLADTERVEYRVRENRPEPREFF